MKFSLKRAASRLFGKRTERTYADGIEEQVYYAPEKDMSRTTELVGIAFRGLTVFCAVYGLTHFLYQAIGLYKTNTDSRFFSLSAWFMAAVCLLFSLMAAAASYNRITRAALPAAAVAGMFASAAAEGNPIVLFENAARRLYNGVVQGLVSSGYTDASSYAASADYSFPDSTLLKWSVVLFAALLAFLFYFSVAGKTRAVLFALTVGAVVFPVFFFNISKGNLGFAFIVASVAGFISMRIVDRRYGGALLKKQNRKRAREENRIRRSNERDGRKLEKLRLRAVADRVYNTAIDAEMGERRAKMARRSVIKKAKQDKKEAEKLGRKAIKEAKRAEKQRKKEEAALAAKEPRETRLAAKREAREKELTEYREKRRNRAASGYAAAAATALALIAAAIPFAASKKPFRKIPFIDEQIKNIRTVVTDLLMGDAVDLTKDPYGEFENFHYETLNFDERNYRGVQIFRVEAPTARPVFLKSRTALDYDNEKNRWSFASSGTVLKMKQTFGGDFTSDVITKNAYSYLYPVSGGYPEKGSSIALGGYGFSVEQVHVLRVNGKCGILLVPSTMNPDIGVLEYDSMEEASSRYSAFYDGIYTSRHFGAIPEDGSFENGYSTVSFVYDLRRPTVSDVLESEKTALDLAYSLALRAEDGEDSDALAAEYVAGAKTLPVYNNIGERYFGSMSRDERSDFRDAMELEHAYRAYANETYTKAPDSKRLAELAKQIFIDAKHTDGSSPTRYETVMAVVEYLGDYSYSLKPTVPADTSQGALEAFLFDTKEGYCSHFATAATVLLRELGIPARYAEGYRVGGWYSAGGRGTTDKYRADVMDENSHTWVEVYFDAVGWIPFEVTKSFTDGLYEESAAPDSGEKTDDEEYIVPDTVTPPEEEPEQEEAHSATVSAAEHLWMVFKKYLKIIIIVAAVLIAVRILIMIVKKLGDDKARRRGERIRDAKDEDHYRAGTTDNRSEAKYLIDTLFKLFETFEIGPEKGEQLSEFAARLRRDYIGLSSVDPEEAMRCVLKEEFGHGLTYTETYTLASYLEDTVKTIYTGLSRTDRIKYRYIKHII